MLMSVCFLLFVFVTFLIRYCSPWYIQKGESSLRLERAVYADQHRLRAAVSRVNFSALSRHPVATV